jgi:hypothetical protein
VIEAGREVIAVGIFFADVDLRLAERTRLDAG